MKSLKVAAQYSKALFDATFASNQMNDVLDSMSVLRKLWKTMPDLRTFLRSPQIEAADKKSIIRSIFQGADNQALLNLMDLLIDENRMNAIEEITDEYERLVHHALGILEVSVVTAVPLTDDSRTKLIKNL